MTTRIGIIGLGIMGRRFMPYMAAHEAFALGPVWDPSEAQREAARALGTGAEIAGSAEAVIAGSDLVYLACPPVPRKAYALAAAEAGKALFIEKPFGVDLGEARDLAARLAASGVPAAVNFTQAAGKALATVTGDAEMGEKAGVDIVVTYANWPREWQKAADWLRFSAEGGMTREVISHFLFFSARVLGPLSLVWARPTFPADPALCETHMAAGLVSASGAPVSVFAAVGGAQPDRQELNVKGARASWRVSDFYALSRSTGGAFEPYGPPVADPRAESLRAQLGGLAAMMRGEPHPLATVGEALAVQELVEAMLAGR